MLHDHPFPATNRPAARCRICGSNDPDALVDEIAERLWEGSRDVELKDPPWAEAPDYWQMKLRSYAREMLDVVRR